MFEFTNHLSENLGNSTKDNEARLLTPFYLQFWIKLEKL